jgi:DNA-binding NtrC family response regulator
VVEDEAQVRSAMRHALEHLGCIPVEASGYEEAVERAQAEKPMFVIADCQLGQFGSGAAVVQELRRHWPGLPALLVTGDTDGERAREAGRMGVQLLQKPMTLVRLKRAMCEALAQGNAPV